MRQRRKKNSAVLRQQSFIAQDVIHLFENEKTTQLQITSIIMRVGIMLLRLKMNQSVSRFRAENNIYIFSLSESP